MKKLIVADFDGTLLPYGQMRVSEKTILYINDIIARGFDFAVASGRTYSELKSLLHGIKGDIYYICDDGAVTLYKDKVIFKKQFSAQALRVFFDEDIFKSAVLYSIDKAYMIGDCSSYPLYGKTPQKVKRPFELVDDIFKIAATVKCFDLVNTNLYRVHYSEGYFAEFVSPYANKGVAVADLQMKLGVSKFDTYVIGDAANDISMVQHANRSWAVGTKSAMLVNLSTDAVDSADMALDDITNNILAKYEYKNNIKQH